MSVHTHTGVAHMKMCHGSDVKIRVHSFLNHKLIILRKQYADLKKNNNKVKDAILFKHSVDVVYISMQSEIYLALTVWK